MEQVLDKCSKCDCGEKRYIVNKTHYLCNEKNRLRLDNQLSPADKRKKEEKIIEQNRVRLEKNKKYSKDMQSKPKAKIKFISPKKMKVKKAKHDTYKIIDSKRPKICEGCGRSDRNLSHSHLISEGYDDKYAAVEENIRLHCMSSDGIMGCHEKWEAGEEGVVNLMLDFADNMIILHKLDRKYYNIKMNSIYGDS